MCGIATYTTYLAEQLIKQGDEVVVLAERRDVLPTGFDSDFPGKNIPYRECWSRNEPFDKLIEVVKEEKPDIVHCQHQFGLFPYEMTFLKELKELGIKVILTLHDVIPAVPDMEKYFRTIFDNCDKIIVHNETCKRLLLDSWKYPHPERIEVIYHGTKLIDVPTVEKARKKLAIPMNT
jgi:glycosyltransferase involved in cell wall biosynthesis